MVSSLFEGTPVQIRIIISQAGNVNKYLQNKLRYNMENQTNKETCWCVINLIDQLTVFSYIDFGVLIVVLKMNKDFLQPFWINVNGIAPFSL